MVSCRFRSKSGGSSLHDTLQHSILSSPIVSTDHPEHQAYYDYTVDQTGCSVQSSTLDCLRKALFYKYVDVVNQLSSFFFFRTVASTLSVSLSVVTCSTRLSRLHSVMGSSVMFLSWLEVLMMREREYRDPRDLARDIDSSDLFLSESSPSPWSRESMTTRSSVL